MTPSKKCIKINAIGVKEIGEKVEILNITLLDCGRTSFYCKSENQKFWIRTVANGLEETPYKDGYWPGGLYLNDKLIAFNSDEERELISVIKRLSISKDYLCFFPEDKRQNVIKSTNELVSWIVDFLKSDNYIRLAEKTGRKVAGET